MAVAAGFSSGVLHMFGNLDLAWDGPAAMFLLRRLAKGISGSMNLVSNKLTVLRCMTNSLICFAFP